MQPLDFNETLEKNQNGKYSRMLCPVFITPWKQHSTKQQLYDHLPHISLTIQVKHAGHRQRSADRLIKEVLLRAPRHGHTHVGWPANTNIPQLCADTGCRLEDRPFWKLALCHILPMAVVLGKYIQFVTCSLERRWTLPRGRIARDCDPLPDFLDVRL